MAPLSPYAATPNALGKAACAFLLDRRGWTIRHVEHLDFIEKDFLRRRVTVDIRLPSRGGSLGKVSGKTLYVVPAVVLRKDTPVTELDLRDESGASLPLLTRAENGAISAEAAVATARRLAGRRLPEDVVKRLRSIAQDRPAAAKTAYRSTSAAGTRAARRILAHPSGPSFDRFLVRMIDNSVVWLPLLGAPGQRRIVKLGYAEPRGLPDPAPQVRFGIRPLEFVVDSPYLPDTGTYHLQILNPPGIEALNVRLEGELEQREGELPQYKIEPTRRGAHIYLDGYRGGEAETVVAFELRIARGNFLTPAAIACVLIAALLGAFALFSTELSHHRDVSGPLLLVVPALLLIFSQRREHDLATIMLSGVRTLVFTSGVLAAMAALVLAGPQPLFDQHAWWSGLAVAATVLALFVVGIWVLAGKSVRPQAET